MYSLIKQMQFIPKRELMKAGKYMGLTSSWDMEQWYVCTHFNILSGYRISVPSALLCLLFYLISSLSAQNSSEVLLKWQH